MSRVATSTDETPKPACFLSRNLRLAGSAVLLCLWWGSLHKALQLDLRSTSLHAIAPWPFHDLALSGNTIAALSTALGIIGGCLLLFLACRRREGILRSRKAQQQLLLIEMILSALFYLAILIPVDTPKICSVLYGGVCACAVGNIAIIGGKLETFDNRQVVTVALFGLGADMILAPTFPPLFAHAPLLAAFFSLACVAGLALLNRRLDGGSCPSEKTTWIAELNRMPVFLAFTLFAYGFVFGAAEVLRGQLSDSSPFGCLPDISSTAIAVIVLTVLFYGRPASVELWSRLRGTVFPLTLIGVALMPATAQGSLVVIGGSDLLFYAFLAAICVDVVQLTGIGIALIVANVLFWRALGAFTGTFAILLGGSLQSLSPESYSLLAALIIAALSAATLWIGSDEQIRKNWGLRPKLAPKQFNDAAVQHRCEVLAATYRLTPRETQFITALAQGRRPAEIQAAENVTIHTVRAHIQHAYGKLGIHSTAELQALLKTVPLDEGKLTR